ncbi:hypothetical protein COCNU_11G009440 [Cocos nucifera]|uniref:Uncharacterized protein n=1 Tax=Cocos nucifera TaxID=13894 RepID=A0A8K0N9T4_COCNU|nr:hypothetical protein COCNU_11G009440 [Cocos nucifera]
MDPLMAKTLKKLSARRLRTRVSSAQSQTSGSSSIEASDIAPLIVFLPVSINTREDDPLSVSDSQNLMKDVEIEPVDSMRKVIDAAVNSIMKAAVEIIPIISPIHAMVEMEEDHPEGTTKSMEKAGPLCSAKGIEVIELQGPEVSSFGIRPTKIRMEMASSVPFSSSVVDSLRIAAEFLGSHLAPEDSHTLANFVEATSGYSPLELVELKGELDKFKYYLEQEKAVNANLIKKIDCSEKALFEAREAHDVTKCLKKMLAERRGTSSEAHFSLESDIRLSKWPRSSNGDYHEEEASQRLEVFLSRRGPTTQESSAELQTVREGLK